MNWEVVGTITDIVATLAVIASLVYVGRQVRDSSRQTRVNTSSNIAANFQDGWQPIYNSEVHSSTWSQGRKDPNKLSEDQLAMFLMLFDRQFFNYETAIVAYEEGAYDPSLFKSCTGLFKILIHEPGGRYWLANEGFPVTSRAKEYLDVS